MATAKDSGGGVAHECYFRCTGKNHASHLTAVVTRARLSDEKIAAYLKWCCIKYAEAVDLHGRTVVHVAAAKGRLKLLLFLLSHPNVDINFKDLESGFTALHRSLFYGQINCAVRLVQSGANLQEKDLDDLTPLDHVMKDKPAITCNASNPSYEIYVWGTNTSFNLGIGHNNSKPVPNPLGTFYKKNISIKQVCMSKFHSLFLEEDGKVWVCGLNSRGRLGLGDESTSLVPTILKVGSRATNPCKSISVGINHSLLLMENHTVWSFGLNDHQQLGHDPSFEEVPSPKLIDSLKGIKIIGISASKCYSVFWSKYMLYACGSNTGQLGDLKSNEPFPKLLKKFGVQNPSVECNRRKEILHVATCDGAMVVIYDQNAYLFQNYKFKKFRFEQPCQKVCIISEHTENETHLNSPQDKKMDEIKVVMICEDNKIYFWRESHQFFVVCTLSLRRSIYITDIFLNATSLMLATKDGEAFFGDIKIKKNKSCSLEQNSTYNYIIKLERIPFIHRAVRVASDIQGENFSVIQIGPKKCLSKIQLKAQPEMKENMKIFLDTTSESDTLHDVVFQVENVRFPAHSFIINHCEVMKKMLSNSKRIENKYVVVIKKIKPKIFERILSYIYTGDCDLLHVGICPISFDLSLTTATSAAGEEKDSPIKILTNPEEMSAFEYYKLSSSGKKMSPSKIKNKTLNPLNFFKDAAKIFCLTDLIEKLDCLFYDNGYICENGNQVMEIKSPKFKRNNFTNISDVSFKSEDGKIIEGHKCILVARSEYFNCLINKGWLESYQKTPINLPIPSAILEILFNYLYENEVADLLDSCDANFLYQVLVTADQIFCNGLKRIAEEKLQKVLNLKNAVDMLQISVTFNANQLKQSSMEYICLNLTEIFESRGLEILEDSVLTDLSEYYRNWLPCMTRRNIVTTDDEPSEDFIEKIHATEPVSFENIEKELKKLKTGEFKKSAREKVQRKKTKSESERVFETPANSDSFVNELSTPKNIIETFETSKKSNEDAWIKVTSHNSKQNKMKGTKFSTSPPKTPSAKTPPISIPKSSTAPISVPKVAAERDHQTSPSVIKSNSFNDSDKNALILSESFEKEFPSLNFSPTERTTTNLSPKSPIKINMNFVKLSQKQRKKLAMESVNEMVKLPQKSPDSGRCVWDVSKLETDSMADIIKNEYQSLKSSGGSILSGPTWQIPTSPLCSFSAIMAAERNERNQVARMKSKPLEYTQMEEKAIDDLKLLYNVSNVTDEKITIGRAEMVFVSPPVWVSSHK